MSDRANPVTQAPPHRRSRAQRARFARRVPGWARDAGDGPSPPRRRVRLAFPAALLWLLAAPLALLALPIALAAQAGLPRARRVDAFAAVGGVLSVLAALGGTLVEVDAPYASVTIRLF